MTYIEQGADDNRQTSTGSSPSSGMALLYNTVTNEPFDVNELEGLHPSR